MSATVKLVWSKLWIKVVASQSSDTGAAIARRRRAGFGRGSRARRSSNPIPTATCTSRPLTGEVLYAKAFAPITTSTGVDLETGRLLYNPETAEQVGRITRGICPASPGGKDWQPSAYSPKSGLLYIPHNNLCQDSEPAQTSYIAGTPYVGMDVRMYAGPGGHRGELTAGKRCVPPTGLPSSTWAE
jgi:hypothetical protein